MSNSGSKKGLPIIGGAILVFILVVLDQITKWLAVTRLAGQDSYVLIPGVFELQYLENRGAAFGILQNQQWLFILLFILFLIAAIYFYVRMISIPRFVPLQMIALFVVAGGLGNIIDRIFRGFVVDFFYFSLIDFPIFNVADIYVTVSMAFLFIFILFYYKEEDLELLFARKK